MEHVDVGPPAPPIFVELPRAATLRADDLAGWLDRSMARNLGRRLRSHLSHTNGYIYRDYRCLTLAHG